jgi:hypothetical protein
MHVSVTTYLATPSCLYRHYCSNLLRGDKAAVFFRIEITATALFFLAVNLFAKIPRTKNLHARYQAT